MAANLSTTRIARAPRRDFRIPWGSHEGLPPLAIDVRPSRPSDRMQRNRHRPQAWTEAARLRDWPLSAQQFIRSSVKRASLARRPAFEENFKKRLFSCNFLT